MSISFLPEDMSRWLLRCLLTYLDISFAEHNLRIVQIYRREVELGYTLFTGPRMHRKIKYKMISNSIEKT